MKARTLSALLRAVAVACAVLSVALPAGSDRRPPTRTTVFVLDTSDSIAPATVERARAAIEAARAPEFERTEIVTFDGDVRAALARAASLSPGDVPTRLVLLTDGHVDPATADRLVPLRSDWRDDVVALGLEVPADLRTGETFDAVLRVVSGSSVRTRAMLTIDHQVVVEGLPVELKAGQETLVRFRNLPGLERQGVHVVRAHVPVDDARPGNNHAAACLFLHTRPQALVVGAAAPFDAVLKTQGMDVETASASSIGAVEDLDRFDAIVLASDVPEAAIERVARAVRDGAGLCVVLRSPDIPENLAALLPVTVKKEDDPGPTPGPGPQPPQVKPVRQIYEAPPIALLLLVDTSGSMSGENLALAKEAVLATADTLSRHDILGVLGFNTSAYEIVPFTRAGDRRSIEASVLRVMAAGSTNIARSLAEGAALMSRRTESIRHIILLSDGLTPAAGWDELLSTIKRHGMTVTTVCVGMGSGFDAKVMSAIADQTGGRFIFSADFKSVPKIFTREARRIIRSQEEGREPEDAEPPVKTQPDPPRNGGTGASVETPRRVTRKDAHEATRGIEAFPDLWGMVPTDPRPTAIVALQGGVLPLLAVGRVGLGEVAVWTSDFGGSWGREWRGKPETARLIAQLARSIARSTEGPEPRPTVLGPGPDGAYRFRIEAGGADLRAEVLAPEPRTLPLVPAAGSALEATFTPDEMDTLYRLRVMRGERAAVFGLIEPYSPELRVTEANEDYFKRPGVIEVDALGTLWDEPAPAREVPRPILPGLVLAAAILLLADVGVRRLGERAV